MRKDQRINAKRARRAPRIPQSRVSKVEIAERRIDVMELRAWCHALGVPTELFVARLENCRPDPDPRVGCGWPMTGLLMLFPELDRRHKALPYRGSGAPRSAPQARRLRRPSPGVYYDPPCTRLPKTPAAPRNGLATKRACWGASCTKAMYRRRTRRPSMSASSAANSLPKKRSRSSARAHASEALSRERQQHRSSAAELCPDAGDPPAPMP